MKPLYMNPEDVTDESVYDHGFNDAIDEVLEIIDSNYPDPNAVYSFSEYEAADAEGQEKALDRIKDAVLELKRGEQE